MRLTVTGVETIEITDPNGVCENQRQQVWPIPGSPMPNPNLGPFPMPGQPPPINPIPLPAEIGRWRRPLGPTYEHHDAEEKWQVGLNQTGDFNSPPRTTTGDNMRSAYGNGDTKDTHTG